MVPTQGSSSDGNQGAVRATLELMARTRRPERATPPHYDRYPRPMRRVGSLHQTWRDPANTGNYVDALCKTCVGEQGGADNREILADSPGAYTYSQPDHITRYCPHNADPGCGNDRGR